MILAPQTPDSRLQTPFGRRTYPVKCPLCTTYTYQSKCISSVTFAYLSKCLSSITCIYIYANVPFSRFTLTPWGTLDTVCYLNYLTLVTWMTCLRSSEHSLRWLLGLHYFFRPNHQLQPSSQNPMFPDDFYPFFTFLLAFSILAIFFALLIQKRKH